MAKLEANNVTEEVKKVEEPVSEYTTPTISIDDFSKIKLVVGKVISCEKHKDADHLLISKIDVGNGEVRQIVSGIASSYTAGQMIGRKVIVVQNLRNAIIRGVESQGMILAGENDGLIEVASVAGLPAGTIIR